MVTVEVCIGSACYVKGSNVVVTLAQKMIDDNNWAEQVTLKGSFCMNVCNQGLGLKINGKLIEGVGLHNASELIYQEIKAVLE